MASEKALTPAELVFAYHARTKHTLERYAAGPETLDYGVYHYLSRDHVLEQRCRRSAQVGPRQRLLVGLTSVHWREAWKYGERAFRYCQLDAGHALGAFRYAAGALGWRSGRSTISRSAGR